MGDRTGGYTISVCNKPTRSTQPCIPPGSLNRVPVSTGGKGGNVTSAGWQVTLCDTMWRVSSRSGVATLQTAIHLLLSYFLTQTHTDHGACDIGSNRPHLCYAWRCGLLIISITATVFTRLSRFKGTSAFIFSVSVVWFLSVWLGWCASIVNE